jgi:hypothetical protein
VTPSNRRSLRMLSPAIAAVGLVVFLLVTLVPRIWPRERYRGVLFEDVTLAAGIDYIQDHQEGCEAWMECGPEVMSGGAAAADYDNDGWIDLAVTRIDAPPLLYRNTGDGKFVDVSAEARIGGPGSDLLGSNGAAWGDVNNDGCLDLYLTRIRARHHALFISDCKGRFREEAVARRATPVEEEPTIFGTGVAFGDYDRDGFIDIFVTEWHFFRGTKPASHNRLFKNRGPSSPGFFEDKTEEAGIELFGRSPLVRYTGVFGFAPAFIDLDDDGWQDLAIAADFGSSGLWWNNRDGTFKDGTKAAGVGTDENGMGSAFADYDNDGRIDWFVTSIFEECTGMACGTGYGITGNRLYRNDGNRVFSDWTDRANVRDGAWGWAASFLDFDNDGLVDIVHTSGFKVPGNPDFDRFSTNPTFLQHNVGDGRFENIAGDAGIADTILGRGLVVFDFDRDGFQDILVVQRSNRPRLFRNKGARHREAGSNGWIDIRLRGTRPGMTRDALGTKIFVTARVRRSGQSDELEQLQVVASTDNYLSHNPYELHFGVGRASSVRVRVVWPDGCLQTYEDVGVGQVLGLDDAGCDAHRDRPEDLGGVAAFMQFSSGSEAANH